jgi:peptidoglycan/xylan/chitin deacetylase (PgdA/CDA1 family)
MKQKIFILSFSLLLLLFLTITSFNNSNSEPGTSTSDSLHTAIRNLYTPGYLKLKKTIMKEFPNAAPGRFGEFVKGVDEDLVTNKKVLAFTFDACIGKSNDYNAALIDFLKKEKIPATLFVSGLWIDGNLATFKNLADDQLFEIENHGLHHRLCSVDGETKYGVIATKNIGEVIDEMELNARKIEKITGKRPKFFRSATAYTDETCAKIANQLGMQVVSFDILSGDAVPFTPAHIISENIIKNAKDGAIVIMHFNHPLWYEKQALEMAIPVLRSQGYTFVKLEDYKLKGK